MPFYVVSEHKRTAEGSSTFFIFGKEVAAMLLKKLKSRQGISLPLAMAITAVLIILSASLIAIAASSIMNTSSSVNNRQAYLNVRSAIEYAYAYYSDSNSVPDLTKIENEYMVMNDKEGGTTSEGAQIVSEADVEEYTFLRYDLSDALNRNSDTVAWLEIKYCNISYPVVQGKDNEYYLKHDFYGNYTYHGWVFQDFREADVGAKNIVIYGHNLMAGGMFSNLSDILESKEPVYVQYQSTYDTRVYEVVSAYVTEPVIDYIKMDFTDEEFKTFEDNIVKKNEWKYAPKVELNADDRFLTLSTCHGDNRLAVHCRLVEGYILPQN